MFNSKDHKVYAVQMNEDKLPTLYQKDLNEISAPSDDILMITTFIGFVLFIIAFIATGITLTEGNPAIAGVIVSAFILFSLSCIKFINIVRYTKSVFNKEYCYVWDDDAVEMPRSMKENEWYAMLAHMIKDKKETKSGFRVLSKKDCLAMDKLIQEDKNSNNNIFDEFVNKTLYNNTEVS